MRTFLSLCLLLTLTSCSRPPDLNTPCPDYGRFCPQQPINNDIN
ncbi:T4SS-associated protein LvhB7 [Legionella spiritensis]|nr:T4SS-associated protein LvhB7 [Legionella spiritensis]